MDTPDPLATDANSILLSGRGRRSRTYWKSDIAATLTGNGYICQPPPVTRTYQNRFVDKSLFKPRGILAANLKGLMAAKVGPTSQLALGKKSGVAQATIGRILRKETSASIETVEDLAKAYGLQGWQLMVAGMDPTNPPVLQAVSREERALYERLKAAVEDVAKLK